MDSVRSSFVILSPSALLLNRSRGRLAESGGVSLESWNAAMWCSSEGRPGMTSTCAYI